MGEQPTHIGVAVVGARQARCRWCLWGLTVPQPPAPCTAHVGWFLCMGLSSRLVLLMLSRSCLVTHVLKFYLHKKNYIYLWMLLIQSLFPAPSWQRWWAEKRRCWRWRRTRLPGGPGQEDDAPLSNMQQGLPQQVQHQGAPKDPHRGEALWVRAL